MAATELAVLCGLAQEAVREAGVYARGVQGKVSGHLKSEGQVVTEADVEAQRLMVAHLLEHGPAIGVLAEEGADGGVFKQEPGDGTDRWWVIDPIDGTRNYACGLPTWGVMAALMEDGEPVLGVIYLPCLDTMYHAVKGGQAYRNGEIIRATTEQWHDNSIFALPCRHRRGFDRRMEEIATRGIAMIQGSAALHLAFVGQGSVSGMYSFDTRLWDIAAGMVVCEAAGARVSKPDGGGYSRFDVAGYEGEACGIMAAGKKIWEKLKFFLDGDSRPITSSGR